MSLKQTIKGIKNTKEIMILTKDGLYLEEGSKNHLLSISDFLEEEVSKVEVLSMGNYITISKTERAVLIKFQTLIKEEMLKYGNQSNLSSGEVAKGLDRITEYNNKLARIELNIRSGIL